MAYINLNVEFLLKTKAMTHIAFLFLLDYL